MTNLKNILKIYALERDLNPDDVALLNTLRALTESEREVMVEALSPGKAKGGSSATGATTKRKIEHCGVCDFTRWAAHHKDVNHKDYHEFHARTERPGKSARASSLQQQIQGRTKGASANGGPCTFRYPDDAPAYAGQICTGDSNNPIHDPLMAYAGYHEFQPPVRSVAGAGD